MTRHSSVASDAHQGYSVVPLAQIITLMQKVHGRDLSLFDETILAHGFDGYLSKPIDRAELMRVLHQLREPDHE